jgi:hypothetical protein
MTKKQTLTQKEQQEIREEIAFMEKMYKNRGIQVLTREEAIRQGIEMPKDAIKVSMDGSFLFPEGWFINDFIRKTTLRKTKSLEKMNQKPYTMEQVHAQQRRLDEGWNQRKATQTSKGNKNKQNNH